MTHIIWTRAHFMDEGLISTEAEWQEFIKYMNDSVVRFFEEKE